MRIERPTVPNLSESIRHVNREIIVNAVISFIFCVTGPLAVLLGVAATAGLSGNETYSWVFANYFFGGLFTVLVSVLYRQPIAILWAIPGAVLLTHSLGALSFGEVVGAYLITAVLLALFGMTGWIKKGMEVVPTSIIMAMVAGVFLPMGLKIVAAFQEIFWAAAASVAAFLLFTKYPKWSFGVPPVLTAIVAGCLTLLAGGAYEPGELMKFSLAKPEFYLPQFSFRAMLELVIPLTVTVVGIQHAQGIAILKQAGYDPPVNAMTFYSGVGSIVMGLFGGISSSVAGPVSATLNIAGDKKARYAGAVLFGLLMMVFGLLSPSVIAFFTAFPIAFIGLVGGLALLKVLESSFVSAFSKRTSMGALVTFIITVSDIRIFNIGAAFWGLMIGLAVHWLIDRK